MAAVEVSGQRLEHRNLHHQHLLGEVDEERPLRRVGRWRWYTRCAVGATEDGMEEV